MQYRLSRLCLIPLVFSLACNALSSGPATQTAPNTATSISPNTAVPALSTAAATTTPLPAAEVPGLSLEQAVREGVASGKWTYEQGLLTGLRFMMGELSSDEAFGSQPLRTTEGTALIRRAQRYVTDGQDAQTKVEIEQALRRLMPSPETLDMLTNPAALSGRGNHLASPVRQDAIACQTLWRDSFAITGAVDCLKVREDSSSGTTVRFYYPSYWDAADPRLASVDDIMVAANLSLTTFNTYGPDNVMPVYMVLTDWSYFSTTGEERGFLPDVFAAAYRDSLPLTSCHVGIFPHGLEGGIANIQQTVAHELFHCYQYTNLAPQIFGGLGESFSHTETYPDPDMWWSEGSAEFFGAVVYPRNNDEWIFNDDFDAASPNASLVDLDYENYLLFQYLNVQTGYSEESIINILRSMPSSGGRDAQLAALAAIPDINEVFFNFVRDYIDRRLVDGGGGEVPVNPVHGEAIRFGEGSHTVPFSSDPFVVARFHVEFEDDMRFTIDAEENDGTGKYSVRPTAFVGAWSNFKPTLNTACNEKSHILVVTNTAPPGAETYKVTVTADGEELEGEDPQCDRCLLGTWQLDNESLLMASANLQSEGAALGGGLPPGLSVEVASVTGSMIITFYDNQSVTGEQNGLTLTSVATGPDGNTLTTEGSYSGTAEATYQIRKVEGQNTITYSNGEYALTYTQTLIFGDVQSNTLPPISMDDTNFSFFLSGTELYDCSETILLFTSAPTLGALQFVRVQP